MNPHLINVDQLKDLTGYSRSGDVINWLERHQIPYFIGAGGNPVTTLDALNARLLNTGALQSVETETIDFSYGQKA